MKAKEKKISIGRERGCDIVLADDSVSRHHAELTFLRDGKLLLTDCKSRNGTFLVQGSNDKPVRQLLVSPMDTLQFGDIKISVKELLESIHLKFPSFNTGGVAPPDENPPPPRKPWVKGTRLVRCDCGAIKSNGEVCPECGK
ncbi:MAG: FHA domain-containing protein [bacterium]|nr:FHA domain-containing protein [bacterium]